MEEQGFLLPEKRGKDDREILDEMILARCKTRTQAIDYCIEISPWTRQQVAFKFEIDIGHLNRMLNVNDKMNFPQDLVNDLMEFCGNLVPLRFEALKARHGIHRLKTAVEEENEALRAELKRREEREQAVADFFRRTGIDLKLAG